MYLQLIRRKVLRTPADQTRQSLFYHTTLYYQQVQGTGAVGAMLRFLPTSISGILCNVLVAFLVSKVKTQYLVCTGLLATA